MQVTPPFFHKIQILKILSHSILPLVVRDRLPAHVCVRVLPSKFVRLIILHLSPYRAIRAKYSVSRDSSAPTFTLINLLLALRF